MIKAHEGNKLWTAVNPLTGKPQIADPEGELISGEQIVKLYYCKRLDRYVTVPGSLFKVRADTTRSNVLAKIQSSKITSPEQGILGRLSSIQEGRCESNGCAPIHTNEMNFSLMLAGLSNYLVRARQQRVNDFIRLYRQP